MTDNNLDELLFSEDEAPQESAASPQGTWPVLIVDDEPDVHDITVISLSKFIFQGKSIKFLHAYSGKEARQVIRDNPQIAVILLDVVMETEDSGLQVACFIREELGNQFMRIILRTGQPGYAPESEVIQKYDIDDYKEKTELTKLKLTTVMFSSLRVFSVVMALEQSRSGLEKVIQATSTIFKINSLDEFLSGIMLQLVSLINPGGDGFLAVCESGLDRAQIRAATILIGVGAYQAHEQCAIADVADDVSLQAIQQAASDGRYAQTSAGYAFVLQQNSSQNTYFIFIQTSEPLEQTNRHLVDLFCANVCLAYANVSLYQEIEDTQKEMIFKLGAVAEFRSRETSNHVRRVAEYSKILAQKVGLDKSESELIRLASPMHDIGKLGIPDVILQKKGRLTVDEFEVMKTHAQIGFEMLNGSNRAIFQAAAIIALEHQEKWDGSGYPRGLKGEDIHLYGRITVIADVFDALASKRCYKEAWPIDKVKAYFVQNQGQHFDPQLTQLFLADFDVFVAIKNQYKD